MDIEKTSANETSYNYYGAVPEGKPQSREVKKSPSPRVERIRKLYFETKS